MKPADETEYERLTRADIKTEARLVWSELLAFVFVAGLVAAYLLFFPA
jgi:hypothetical protein